MAKKITKVITFVLFFLLLLPACTVKENSLEVQTTLSKTITPVPTKLPTATATPTVQPTPKIVYPVLMNTTWPLPSQQILATNVDHLSPLASLGYGLIYDAAVSADQSQLAVGTANGFYIYDANTFKVTSAVGTTSPVTIIAFSPDGKYVATGNVNNIVQLWNISNNELIRTLGFTATSSDSGWNDELNEIKFSSNGKYLEVTGTYGYKNYVKFWDLSSGTNIQTFENTSSCTVKISPNGSDYAVATDDSIAIFQFENDTPITNLDIKNANQIKYSPDGHLIAAVTGNIISIINLVDGSTFEKVYGNVMDFSPDNSTFAITNGKGTIDIYSISSDETKATLKYYLNGYGTSDYFGTVNSNQCGGLVDYGYGPGFVGVLKNGVFSPDGKYIAVKNENYCATNGNQCSNSSGRKERLAIYSLKDGSLINTLLIPPDGYQWPNFKFNKVLFIGDNIVTLSEDTEYGAILRVWDINTKMLVKEINPIHPALPIAFTPDNTKLVTYSLLEGSKLFVEDKQPQEIYSYKTVNEYEFSLWDIADGKVIEDFEGGKILDNRIPTWKGIAGPEHLVDANFSPDGTQFAYNGFYYYYKENENLLTARTWNIGQPQPTDEAGIIAYAPDGTIAKTNVSVIEIIKDSKIAQTLTQDYGTIRCLNYSKDGTLLAAGYDQNIVVVWRLETGTPIQTLSTGPYINSIRFSENNEKVIVGSYDSIKIFDLVNGSLIKSLEDGSYGVGFDVSPVSDLIVVIPRTSWLDQIRIYNTSGSLLRTIHTPYRTEPDVKFSPDGTMLAISLPGSVQIWGIEPMQ